MLLDILGWFYIIIGVISLIKPDWLRSKLQRKASRKIRWFFLGLAFTLGIIFIKAGWGLAGLAGKILVILGIIGIIKGFCFLNGKASEKMIGLLANRSLSTLRYFAVGYLLFGGFLIWVK